MSIKSTILLHFITLCIVCNASENTPVDIFSCSSQENQIRYPSYTFGTILDLKIWRGQSTSYITPHGILAVDGVDFYWPQEYCVDPMSSKVEIGSLTIRYCNINCDDPSTPCVPKCCPLGKSLGALKCEQTGKTPWTPHIYDNNAMAKILDAQRTRLRPHYRLVSMRQTCDLKTDQLVGINHNQSSFPFRVRKDGTIVGGPKNQWVEFPRACVELIIKNEVTSELLWKEDDQLLLYCEKLPETRLWVSIVYTVGSFTGAIFCFLTGACYVLLWQKKVKNNFAGMVFLCLIISYFFLFANYGSARLIGILKLEHTRDSWWCYTIGVFAHFSALSVFTWLIVINFDLWCTFRELKHASNRNRFSEFIYSCMFAWGIPSIILIVAISLNENFPRDNGSVIVPGYGTDLCYLTFESQGPYLYYPNTVFFSISLTFMAMTIFSLWRFTQNNMSLRKNKEFQPKFVLFGKLSLVMGLSWAMELISWLSSDPKETITWYFMIFDLFNMVLPILIFVIFCCNKTTMQQMEQLYPRIHDRIAYFRKTTSPTLSSDTGKKKTTGADKPPIYNSMGSTSVEKSKNNKPKA